MACGILRKQNNGEWRSNNKELNFNKIRAFGICVLQMVERSAASRSCTALKPR
jgi:hypothetical protein